MPYIAPDRRQALAEGSPIKTPGELNYVITKRINQYLKDQTLYYKELSYVDLNDIIGALESAKLEFYRRVVVPYEEKKIVENGDVYT